MKSRLTVGSSLLQEGCKESFARWKRATKLTTVQVAGKMPPYIVACTTVCKGG